jgi:hypothetical protein
MNIRLNVIKFLKKNDRMRKKLYNIKEIATDLIYFIHKDESILGYSVV